jgi:transposase-like protein
VGKIPVLGMIQRSGEVKAMVSSRSSAKAIWAAVKATVAPDSPLYTDEHSSYKGEPELSHKAVNHSAKQFVDRMACIISIESVWALLRLADSMAPTTGSAASTSSAMWMRSLETGRCLQGTAYMFAHI